MWYNTAMSESGTAEKRELTGTLRGVSLRSPRSLKRTVLLVVFFSASLFSVAASVEQSGMNRNKTAWDEGAPRFHGPRAFGATPGRLFRFTFPVCGAREGLRFSISRGTLPEGVALDPATGVLLGRTSVTGESRVVVKAMNGAGEASRDFSLVIGEKSQALTPPMGWTSWNAFTDEVTQKRVQSAARALVARGLAAYGYQYVNIDSCWQGERTAKDTRALQPNAAFPDMAGLVRDIHALGLKAGIYSTPMVVAWGTTAERRYRGGSDYPLDMNYFQRYFGGCGTVGYEACDARQFADWGFDWLKYDWPDTDVEHARRMRAALDATGRDIVLQLCTDCAVKEAEGFVQQAQLARGNLDTHDDWNRLFKHNCFNGVDPWLGFIRPGFWYDTDMLVVGSMRIGRKTSVPQPGEPLPAEFANRLTRAELESHFAWWAIIPSPLFLSCDLERMDDWTLALVTNEDLLDINQDYPATAASYEDYESGAKRIWRRTLSDGRRVLGFFNLNGDVWNISRSLDGPQFVRDALAQTDLGSLDELKLTIPQHSCRVFLLK